MRARQPRLFPDPRPLVDRFGVEFFRAIPSTPGVYFLKDHQENVLYVGKAGNLRRRLGSYRVANPDRLPRRLIRLLFSVRQIEWQPFDSEPEASARELGLIRQIRPPFNRAGMRPGPAQVLALKFNPDRIELRLTLQPLDPNDGWVIPDGLRTWTRPALVRVLWITLHPGATFRQLPQGWIHGQFPDNLSLTHAQGDPHPLEQLQPAFRSYGPDAVATLQAASTAALGPNPHPFDLALLESDLTTLQDSLPKPRPVHPGQPQRSPGPDPA